jgi:hypothetical protein
MGLIHGAHLVFDPPAATGTASLCVPDSHGPLRTGRQQGGGTGLLGLAANKLVGDHFAAR